MYEWRLTQTKGKACGASLVGLFCDLSTILTRLQAFQPCDCIHRLAADWDCLWSRLGTLYKALLILLVL